MKFEIFPDPDPFNPREKFEYTSTLHCRGLIDEGDPETITDREHIFLSVYRYSHGGIALSTTPFSCPWDSGLTGYIWESRAQIREEFNVSRISPRLHKLILDRLRAEIEEFSNYCNGDVYGVETEDGVVFGFYGYEAAAEFQSEQERDVA